MYITLCAVSKYQNIKFFVLKERDSTPSVQMKERNNTDLQLGKFHREQ